MPVNWIASTKRIGLPLILLTSGRGLGFGQVNPAVAPTLSLAQAIQETERHSDTVRQAADAAKAAKSRIGQQNAARSPQLSVVGSATQYDSPSRLKFGGMDLDVVPDHVEQLTLQLNQLLDLSNQVGTAVSQARLFALESQYNFESTNSDSALTATTAYYDALRAEQNVKVAEAALASYQAQLTLNTKLYQGGTGAKINVLRAQSQVSSSESDVLERRNQAHAAKSRLNDLIGKPLDNNFNLVEPTAVRQAKPGSSC